MSTLELAADAAARRRAVDPDRSVILQAPAGSGKTTVLIERLLVLLARAEAPEEVLAITFTRKAAAEMAARVAHALEQPADPLAQAVRERSRARGWRLEDNPNRLRIRTLDSLNRALALQMPLAARGSGSLAVLAQPRGAYAAAARRALLDAQADAALRPDVQLLFERMENDFARCETLLAGMLEKRTHWLPYVVGDAVTQLAQRVRDSVRAVVEARLGEARALLPAAVLRTGLELGTLAARHLQSRGAPAGLWCELAAAAPGAEPGLRQWQALVALALTQEGAWRRRFDVRQGFPKEDAVLKGRVGDWVAQLAGVAGVGELFTEIRLLPDPQLSADETGALAALARLLRLAVAELDLVFGELDRVDYAAIAAAAREALGSVDEPTDLALRLDSRIRHILVDEFQDTSLEQTRLLTLLTAGWTAGDGRTLFLVGDPMQSIYAFREAEVGMFLDARRMGIGSVSLESLVLHRNFRSAPEVVEWNNRVFAASLPRQDDPRTSAVSYSPSVAARPPDSTAGVHLHRVRPGDSTAEAAAIADLVTQLRQAQPDCSIAVLVSARSHAAPIVARLAARQVAVAGVDLVSLAHLGIVRDLAALTQALEHLGDRTAWLAILRAPWCGLSLPEITRLLGAGSGITVWERLTDPQAIAALEPDSQLRLQRVQATLARSLQAAGVAGLARRVEAAWLQLGGPAACAREADLAHARAFFAALAQWTREPDWSGAQDLPQRLEQLYAAQEPGAGPVVQVMTIHHAKGLEFDHVFLPGLGRRRRRSERPLLQWLDLPHGTGGSDLLMVAVPPAAATGPTALGRYVSRLQDQRQRNEATRLLYVAATRARRQLHLFGQLQDATPERPAPAPAAGTLLERLWPAIRDRFPPQALTAPSPAPVSPAAAHAGGLERLCANWQLPPPRDPPHPTILPIAAYEPTPPPQGAAAVEQAVCELLRSQARRLRLPAVEETALGAALGRRLTRLGYADAELAEATRQGLEMLRPCLTDARLQWIFASLGAAAARPEVPLALTGMVAGRLTSVRVDLSFIDPAGARWLIDIAPAMAAQGTPEAPFALRLERHRQLAQELDATPVRAAVYVPAMRVFWELPPG